MSEQEFETYLDQVCARLGLSRERREEIREELRSHLDEHWERISGSGQDRERCVGRVLAEFGPPDRLAAAITRPYHRRVWRIAGVVAASLLLTMLIQIQLRPGQLPDRRSSASPTTEYTMLAGSGGPLLTQIAGADDEPEPQDEALRALYMRVPVVAFDNEPLEAVFDSLRGLTDANIWVNWSALEASGVDRDTPVSLRLKDVTLGRLLDLLCAQTGELGELRFGQSDNVIEISTSDMLRSPTPDIDTVQVVYDVRSILDAARTRWAKRPQEDSRRQGGRSGGGSPWGPTQTSDTPVPDELSSIITDSIAPNTWRVNGGLYSTLEHFAGLLLVRAPSVVQDQVADLLEQIESRLAPGTVRSSGSMPPPAHRIAPGGATTGASTGREASMSKPAKAKKKAKQAKHKGHERKTAKQKGARAGGRAGAAPPPAKDDDPAPGDG